MPRKKEENVIDKKTKAKLTEEIIEEINTTVKSDVVASVVYDIKDSFDKEYKDSIKEQISSELIEDIKDTIKKDQAKLSRKKSFKIFRLYIYILLLIACSCFLIYKLYITGNIDFLEKVIKNQPTTNQTTEVITTTALVKDLTWYKNNYSYLVDNLNITNYELLKNTQDVASLEITDKLIIAYNSLKNDDIIVEGIIYTLDETKLSNAYKNIFGSTEGYDKVNFTVKGLSYAYSSTTNSYIAVASNGVSNEKIVNYIYNVREEEGNLIFECNVALVKDGYVYNIHNQFNKLMAVPEGDLDISSINDRLSSVEYKFKNVDNNYYLVSIN